MWSHRAPLFLWGVTAATEFFFFGCVGSSLLRVGAALRCGVRASHCGGFSCCGARASVVVARGLSSCGSWALERRLSSCGAQAWLLRGVWDLPGPGLDPVSPALAGGFATSAPPGEPRTQNFEVVGVRPTHISPLGQNESESQTGFRYKQAFTRHWLEHRHRIVPTTCSGGSKKCQLSVLCP